MNETSSLSERVIEAAWLILAAGLPSCFAPWGRNFFELPKALLLWAVVAVMGAAWLVRPHAYRLPTLHIRPTARQPLSGVVLLAWVGVLLLATLFSVNPLLSAQGSYQRMQGSLTILCYLALFILTGYHLQTPNQANHLLAAIAWGSAPVVAYGLVQFVGMDPLDWRVEGSPVISTLGRSNFLGGYLVLVLPLTLAGMLRAPTRSQRTAYIGLIGAQLICLLTARARAAWLGAATALAVLVLAAAWDRGYRRLAAICGIAGLVALLVASVTLILLPGLEGSVRARATIWRATWSLIADRPLLGYGPETFSQTFTAVFPPELVYLQGRAVLVDRAHNLVLDTLASTGFGGLLTYVLQVGTALAAGARALAQAPDRRTRVILACGLAAATGHLVETLFSFPVTTTATLFWLTLGMLVAHWSRPFSRPIPIRPLEKGSLSRKLLAALLLLTVLPASLSLLMADTHIGSADRTRTLADLGHSIASARQATLLWPSQPAYQEHLSWLHLERARRGYNTAAEFQAAETALDAARNLAPGDYRVWAAYGELYTQWGQAGEPARFAQAEEAYHQASSLFPGNAMLHTGWGLLYFAQGRSAEAEAQFRQAIALDNTDAWAFWHLGDVLLAQGDLSGAERAYRSALRWQPELIGAYQGLGQLYCRQGRIELALGAYQHALRLVPQDPLLYVGLAYCQWDLGQRASACQTVARGLQTAPHHPDLLELSADCAE